MLPLHMLEHKRQNKSGSCPTEIIITHIEKAPPVGGAFYATRAYKPGSVLTVIYLVLELLLRSSRLLEAVGQTICFSTALLRDRVYIVKPMLPWAECALTALFHPY